MSRVLLVTSADDDAVAMAARVGDWTAVRLVAEGHSVRRAPPERRIVTALLPDADGACFYGHGREDALLGADGPVLDSDNLAAVAGRWLWLYACRAGVEFAGAAVHAGADCAVGFEAAILVEWDESDLPADLRPTFEALTTEIPSLLAAGVRHRNHFLSRLRPLVDAVLDWYLDHPDAPGGFDISAQQLLNLVVRPTEPIP